MGVGTLVNRGKTIELDPELYEKFQNKADLKGQTVKSYVQELLSMYLDREDVLEQLSPALSFISYDKDKILIRDKNRIADIWLKNSKLFCDLCQKDDCPHIHYAMACLELGKLKKK